MRAPSPRRIPDSEREAILATFHSPEFVDQPPQEVFATLLSRGRYLSSIRTMYRVLAEAGETKDRRAQRAPHSHAIPSLTATAPNQIWTWDITNRCLDPARRRADLRAFDPVGTDHGDSSLLDLGLTVDRGWVVIEANAAWGAGLNGCDLVAAAQCIAVATRT